MNGMEQEEREIEISEQDINGAAAIGTAGLRSIDVSHDDDVETGHIIREKSDRIDALHCGFGSAIALVVVVQTIPNSNNRHWNLEKYHGIMKQMNTSVTNGFIWEQGGYRWSIILYRALQSITAKT